MDALGAGLDGANTGGHANYTTTFTTANQAKTILGIPDFSRGPALGTQRPDERVTRLRK